MTDLIESESWEPGIYQIELTDPVIGGPEGTSNRQAKQLANRTVWLKKQTESLGNDKQSKDATLTALAAMTTTADRLIYATGPDTFALTPLTAFMRTLLDDTNQVTALVTLGAAPLASPALTGTPTAPTAPAGTNTQQLSTTAFTQAAIANLVASAPPTLDTLKKIAAAIGNDPNYAAATANELAQKANKATTLGGYGITDAQPLDADLSALAVLVTTGLYTNTGAGTAAARSIVVSGPGLSVSNGNGVAGNPTLTNTGVTALSGTANQVNVSSAYGSVTLSLPQSIHSGATPSFAQVALASDPANAMQAATKQYVDNLANGLNVKGSVLVATTANITLSGTQTVDGVAVPAGARVLVKNQSTPNQNGIYSCSAGAWTRAVDADNWNELVSAFVFVERGTSNADTGWVCTADAGGTIGTTPITVAQFSGAGTVTAGAGISVNGNQVALSASGVIAGSYSKVSVDTMGRVTAGSALAAADIPSLDWSKVGSGKPTTLGGYGITDGLRIVSDQFPTFNSKTAGLEYINGALQIREAGLVGNTQSDIMFAPALLFHWQGRVFRHLMMSSAGEAYWGTPTAKMLNTDNIGGGLYALLGAANVAAIRSTLGIVNTSNFGATSGWWRDAQTGLMIQYGTIAATSEGSFISTFAQAFPSFCLMAVPTTVNGVTSDDDAFARVISWTRQNVTLRAEYVPGTGVSPAGRNIGYIAIGY